MKAALNELGSKCCFSHALCMWMSNCKDPPPHSLSQKKGTWRTELSSENQPTSWSSTLPDPTRRSTAARWPPSTIKGTLMRYLLVLQWEVRSAELHQGREGAGPDLQSLASGQSQNYDPPQKSKSEGYATSRKLYDPRLKRAVKAAQEQQCKFSHPVQ